MPENLPGDGKGLLASLTALAATLVAIAHTRLDLLSSDLEEEREHLLLSLSALFFLGIGVLLATLLVVVAFWDTYRLPVLAVLTGMFLAAGITAWRIALHKAKTKPKLFAASMSELLKDRQQLISRL
jgi:uncharacterized membrane protein YqjE